MIDLLPIDAVLDDLVSALSQNGRAVLQAPPGAGKTTRVPLALLDHGVNGKILMLEPRRLATRAAAERMAQTLGEPVGQTIGYRMRGDSKTSPATRVEVLTEGILTRMIQSDPELPGVAAVIFDEFHERSLAADLGLALVWEARQTLRDDLMVLVMSATLDAGPVAKLLDDAPVITAEGRTFPVEIRHLPRPLPKPKQRFGFEFQAADLIEEALKSTQGGLLAFLPGEAEIRRVSDLLRPRLAGNCILRPLLGALPFAEQRKAIQPEANPQDRKIVLATAIAETSLTIQDVRVVVDCGKARRARFDPARGLSRLVTEPVSRAEATQRAGRAGRVAPGVAFRMWSKAEEGALPAFAPPEVLVADLAPLALELTAWGSAPDDLAFLTPPPAGPWAAALEVLSGLGALHAGRITDHGRKLARIPLHPRLANMVLKAGPHAASIAALLDTRERLPRGQADLTRLIKAIKTGQSLPNFPSAAIKSIAAEAKRLRRFAGPDSDLSAAQALAHAFPERIAQRRAGDGTSYHLSGGQGADLAPDDALSGQAFLVVADLGSNPTKRTRDATIRQALPISEDAIRQVFHEDITWEKTCNWSKQHRKVEAWEVERLNALALTRRRWKDAPSDAMAEAMLDGIRQLGLPLPKSAKLLQARVARARNVDPSLPDVSDEALMNGLKDWLLPYLTDVTDVANWKAFDPLPALQAHVGWTGLQSLDQLVPGHFKTPLGRKIAIDYSGDHPAIALRLQEMFGQTQHPLVAGEPLQVTLLSPAQRPIQITRDIPGFWTGSYADVRKDMRAQYPKHPWPEDPTQLDPTLRAKPRK